MLKEGKIRTIEELKAGLTNIRKVEGLDLEM